MQEDVARFVTPLKWYLSIGEKADGDIPLVMKQMRNDAFAFACILALCDARSWNRKMQRMAEVVEAGKKIVPTHKKWWIKAVFLFVRLLERGTVNSKIDNLLK